MKSPVPFGRFAAAFILASLSVGWIMPLYLAADSYLKAFEILLRGSEQANSFPFFQFGSQALQFGAVWCNFSAVVWATYGLLRVLRGRRTPQQTG